MVFSSSFLYATISAALDARFSSVILLYFRDALLTSCINSLTSIVSGFVIFSVLGYMSYKSGQNIKDVAREGPGLVFIIYPEALSTMPGSTFFSIIFFMMLLTLGLDSSVSRIFNEFGN